AAAFTKEVKAAAQTPATVACMVVETQQEPQTVGELIRFLAQRPPAEPARARGGGDPLDQAPQLRRDRALAAEPPVAHPPRPAPRPAHGRAQPAAARGRIRAALPRGAIRRKVMQPLRESLRRLLDAHQPNPALIVDGLWNLIEANPAASLL